jgi:hypothetical protein
LFDKACVHEPTGRRGGPEHRPKRLADLSLSSASATTPRVSVQLLQRLSSHALARTGRDARMTIPVNFIRARRRHLETELDRTSWQWSCEVSYRLDALIAAEERLGSHYGQGVYECGS